MVLIFLIVIAFGHLNMHINSGGFPGESAGAIYIFLFRGITKKLSAKKHRSCQPYIATHLQIVFQ